MLSHVCPDSGLPQGSGSNIDLCVITARGVDYIRPFEIANVKPAIHNDYRFAPGTTGMHIHACFFAQLFSTHAYHSCAHQKRHQDRSDRRDRRSHGDQLSILHQLHPPTCARIVLVGERVVTHNTHAKGLVATTRNMGVKISRRPEATSASAALSKSYTDNTCQDEGKRHVFDRTWLESTVPAGAMRQSSNARH